MTALVLALALAAFVIGAIVGGPWLRQRRRRSLLATPMPRKQRALLERCRAHRRLPPALRPAHADRVRVFLAERTFVGCAGLDVTDRMRVEIAAQACLLILARSEHVFDRLYSILVYPDEFLVRDELVDDAVVTPRERALAGQSWDTSRIVLSWRDVREAGDGYNVVIHEFAHYLDAEEGAINGAPRLDDTRDYERWTAVMSAAFAELEARDAAGEPTLLDPYAVEDEAEFFAVASEAFFEQPADLAAAHPALYGELARFYRLDPKSW